jgi:hypothetical protein
MIMGSVDCEQIPAGTMRVMRLGDGGLGSPGAGGWGAYPETGTSYQ